MSNIPLSNLFTEAYQYYPNPGNENTSRIVDHDEADGLLVTANPSLSLLQPGVPIAYENSLFAAQQGLVGVTDDALIPFWDTNNDIAMAPWLDVDEVPALDWDFDITEDIPMSFMPSGNGMTMFPVQMDPSEPSMPPPTTTSEIEMPVFGDINGARGPSFRTDLSNTLSPDTIPGGLSVGQILEEWVRKMQDKPYKMNTPEIFFTRQRAHLPFPSLLPSIWAIIIQMVKLEDHLTETENVCEAFKVWTKEACQGILEKQIRIEHERNLEMVGNLRRLMCRGKDVVAEIPWWRRSMGLAPKWREGWQQGLTWSWSTDCVIKTDGRTNSRHCRMCAELRCMSDRNTGL